MNFFSTRLVYDPKMISQTPHVIELFHGSRKVVLVQDWISSKLDLKYYRLKDKDKHTDKDTNNHVVPVSKGKDLHKVSRRGPGTDSFPQGDLEK